MKEQQEDRKNWRESKEKTILTFFDAEINTGTSVFWTSHCLVPQALALDWDLAYISLSSPVQSPAFWKRMLDGWSKNCCTAAAELGKKLLLLPVQEHELPPVRLCRDFQSSTQRSWTQLLKLCSNKAAQQVQSSALQVLKLKTWRLCHAAFQNTRLLPWTGTSSLIPCL